MTDDAPFYGVSQNSRTHTNHPGEVRTLRTVVRGGEHTELKDRGIKPTRDQLPANFREWDRPTQFEWLIGASLEQAAVVMNWDPNKMAAYELQAWNNCRHDVWTIAFKLGLEHRRSNERERLLRTLLDSLPETLR